MSYTNSLDPERIRRVARMYHSNRDAGLALSVLPGSFGRLCRRYGIETPKARKYRERQERRQALEGGA